MADARVNVKFSVDTTALRQAEAEFKRSQQFLTSYQIAENNKRVRDTGASNAQIISSHRSAETAIQKAAQISAQKQQELSKLTTKQLIRDYQKVQADKKNALRAFEIEEDKGIKRALTAKKKALDQELREYKTAALKRGEVLKEGAGAGVGILGTGRNLIGGGLMKAGLAVGVVAGGFKILYDKAKVADDAIDTLDISLAKVGITGTAVRDAMLKDGEVIADEFALRTTDVNRLQAEVAGYGGQVGETNKQIVELAIANAGALNTSAEALAKVFAKASDPENTAQLTRYGLVFRKGATDTEKWTAILEHFGGAVTVAKKTTQDGMGEATRVINKLQDGIDRLANKVFQFLTPVFKAAGQVIEGVVIPVFEAAVPIFEKIWGIFYGLPGIIIQNWSIIKEYVGKALAWIKGAYESVQDFANTATFGLIGKSAADINAEKAHEQKLENLAKANQAFRDKEDKANAANINKRIAEADKLDAALDPNKFEVKTDEQLKAESQKRKEGSDRAKQAQKAEYDILKAAEDKKFELRKQADDFSIGEEIRYWDTVIGIAKKKGQQKEIDEALHQQELLKARIQQGFQGIDLRAPNRNRDNPLFQPLITPDNPDGESPDAQVDAYYDNLKQKEEQAQSEFNNWNTILSPVQDGFGSLFNSMFAGIDGLTQKWAESKNGFLNFAASFIQGLARMASELLARATIFGIISLLTGGVATAGTTLGKFLGFSKGGIVPQYYAGGTSDVDDKSIRIGGFISKMFKKGSDTVPAMLTPGEAILTRKAVQSIGRNNIDRINSGRQWVFNGDSGHSRQWVFNGDSGNAGAIAQRFDRLEKAILQTKYVTALDPWANQQSQRMSYNSWDIAVL